MNKLIKKKKIILGGGGDFSKIRYFSVLSVFYSESTSNSSIESDSWSRNIKKKV